MPRSFDIFCRVVDNYGDIGVCWRLARQLAHLSNGGQVRLWVDDLVSFSRIASSVGARQEKQRIDGVLVLHWADGSTDGVTPADVVIEAFACDAPAGYIARMSSNQIWLNLEYLSAETWVESCHGLPSLQVGGQRKFFYFPGFTPRTGGLLREPDLIERRKAWQADTGARAELLQELGVDPAWLARLRAGARLVYVYCYPQAPLPALLKVLANDSRDTLVLLPEGVWPADLQYATSASTERLKVHSHRFVDQHVLDRLLWGSDLNIVRGEDTLLRALWAGRPMIWQPYPQEDDAHLDKLHAWLALSPFSVEIRETMLAWSQGDAQAIVARLPGVLNDAGMRSWQAHAEAWCAALQHQSDLATRLVAFCTKMGQTG